MLFIQSDHLKTGMRLAKPIYNRNGTLLYERNSKLTEQGVTSIRNFGLIGIYILEPAEPVPPMTSEDIEFERFQSMAVFMLRDELTILQKKKEANKLYTLANSIIKSYGNLYHKINFSQNLRSTDDYIYKHTLNVAILCALISHQLEYTFEEQMDVVMAALLHDIHKLLLPQTYAEKKFDKFISNEDSALVRKSFVEAQSLLQNNTNISSSVRTMIIQHHHHFLTDTPIVSDSILRSTKVLQVAETYDQMTAMKSYTEPISEVSAARYLLTNEHKFDKEIVKALTDSIHILPPGAHVTLTNSDTGVVISENHKDVLRPIVLSFRYNKVYDLGLKSVFNKIQILDVMKTLDNRFVMDKELCKL